MIFLPFHLFLIDFEKIKILGKREKLCYDLAMINNVNRMVQICL